MTSYPPSVDPVVQDIAIRLCYTSPLASCDSNLPCVRLAMDVPRIERDQPAALP